MLGSKSGEAGYYYLEYNLAAHNLYLVLPGYNRAGSKLPKDNERCTTS